MIVGQRGCSRDSIQRMEPGGWPLCHSDGYRAVQPNDGRRADLKQGVIEKHDPPPVGIRSGLGSRVTRSDRGLQGVAMIAATELLRPLECSHTSLNLRLVPQRTVLLR